jgi:uncharacterized membrane protein YebE (DUF533 family)
VNGDLIGAVLRGALGVRRKRSRNALRFLTGGRRGNPLLNPSVLMTAAGVAWGIVDTLKAGQEGPVAAVGSSAVRVPPPPAPTVAQTPLTVPPVPGAVEVNDDALRMLRLVVSAALADGALSDGERATIAEHASGAGASELVAWELAHPQRLGGIVAGVEDPTERATLYVLAFTVVRADEQVSGAERIYLAQLAELLGLDAKVAEELERETAGRIDTQDGQSGTWAAARDEGDRRAR